MIHNALDQPQQLHLELASHDRTRNNVLLDIARERRAQLLLQTDFPESYFQIEQVHMPQQHVHAA